MLTFLHSTSNRGREIVNTPLEGIQERKWRWEGRKGNRSIVESKKSLK